MASCLKQRKPDDHWAQLQHTRKKPEHCSLMLVIWNKEEVQMDANGFKTHIQELMAELAHSNYC